MIDGEYMQLKNAKIEPRLFFYFIEDKGFVKIDADGGRVKSCGWL